MRPIYILCLLVGLFVASCTVPKQASLATPETPQDVAFATVVQASDFNHMLTLQVASDEIKDHLVDGNSIYLEITNHSQNTIEFGAAYNVQLWRYDSSQNKWMTVLDNADSFIIGGDKLHLPPNDPLLSTSSIDIFPKAGITTPTVIRAVVTGTLQIDHQQPPQIIGAYYDFTLHPRP